MHLTEVEFLGHLVLLEGVKVVSSKVCAIKAWPQPICVCEVQAFLGLENYYRRLIKKFVVAASPLTDLICKGDGLMGWFLWTDKCTEDFNLLKDRLVNAPILQVQYPKWEYELQINASNIVCSSVLVQKGDDGKWLPDEYMSHQLSAAESNYSATEHELLAIMLGLKCWRYFLLGKQFKVKTDYASLCWLMQQSSLSRRQACWLDFFSQFDIVIEHVPGRDNQVPDALSHQTANATILTSDSDLFEKICRAQLEAIHHKWVIVKECVRTNTRGFCMRGGLVSRSHGSNVSIVLLLSEELRQEVMRMHHDDPLSGHLGIYRLVGALSKSYYWKGMRNDCGKYCQ